MVTAAGAITRTRPPWHGRSTLPARSRHTGWGLGQSDGDLYAIVGAYQRAVAALVDDAAPDTLAAQPSAILQLRAATYGQVIAALDRAIVAATPVALDR